MAPIKRFLAGRNKSSRIWLVAVLVAFNLFVGIWLFRWRALRRKGQQKLSLRERAQESGHAPYGVMGLSEAEAANRQPDFDLQAEQRKEDHQFMWGAILGLLDQPECVLRLRWWAASTPP